MKPTNDEYEEISLEFTDKHGKIKTFAALYFPDRQISTICDTFENPETNVIETKISNPGMTRGDILQYFSKHDGTCNIELLIRSIMYEAYQKEGLADMLDDGNVRHFWYTHLKVILVGIMGKDESDSIKSAINRSWGFAIDSGAVTYEEMNIFSEKESGRLSIVKDSPFNNIIIAVEKLSFFSSFNWLPRLFNCTLITAGGQPSRAVARRFILELKNLSIDLDQDFHMCVASDLGPSGYYIQEAFKDQFEKAINYYGGSGKVEIHRLFVRKAQVTPDLLKSQGIPWQPKSDKKTRETIWSHFCEKTDGGLYIPVPSGWNGDVFETDGRPMVRALLEMDAFSTSVIEKSFVAELLRIIRETNDESKIMIPEIMRIFNELKNEVSDEVFEKWKRILIDPLKEEFLKDTEAWEVFIDETDEKDKEEINDRYEELFDEKEREKREREPELFDEKDELEEIINLLKAERDKKIEEIEESYDEQLKGSEYILEDVDEGIAEKCEDINNEINELVDEQNDELGSVDEEYDFRTEKYNKFKEEHLTVFNPVEQSLKSDIDTKFAEMGYTFIDLENRDETRDEVGGLCVNSKLLIDENISCFFQPIPTFKGEKLLEKASVNKDLNIGKVRDSFTPTFMVAMKTIWREDTKDIEFVLSETFEMKDLFQEVKDAMEETEKEIEEKE